MTEKLTTDLRQTTVDTYNQSAEAFTEYFAGIGSRSKYVDLVFDMLGNPVDPKVVEIGCGNGRDAEVIAGRTPNYLGFDISDEFIRIAQQKVPEAGFMVADAATFEFPDGLDAIFAFASLLHLDREEVESVFAKAHAALKTGGIFYLSLKYAQEYSTEVKTDQFGQRAFYYYNEPLIEQLAGEGFETARNVPETRGDTQWVEMALRKL